MRFSTIIKFLVILFSDLCKSQETENKELYQSQNVSTDTTDSTTTLTYFSDMPEEMQINYIDALTFLHFDNKIERVMGYEFTVLITDAAKTLFCLFIRLADNKCDNANVNLSTDFDPSNQTEVEIFSKCFEKEVWKPNISNEPILTIMTVPRRYVPIHKCQHVRIRYMEQIPSIGPHS